MADRHGPACIARIRTPSCPCPLLGIPTASSTSCTRTASAAAIACGVARSISPASPGRQQGRAADACGPDRIAVGQGPACAKACPTMPTTFGTKEECNKHAADRIKDLKSRGYQNAGLYVSARRRRHPCDDVLHHADKPEIYANFPNRASARSWNCGRAPRPDSWTGPNGPYGSNRLRAPYRRGSHGQAHG